ncbi:DNA-binding LacI/PurR family transcriptional regulator [Paenibacillus sp. V4I3]|uniref:GntR family transcriptional regulator n=1 Tax=unclassified Paenibacillus TaxID=185978 RepID=UPI00277D3293|nr:MULTISPECIES: substrate-binding domain-containing protein [unclassified Paenibacillus]MDQ0873864.1 DNA-binding LacI/PurR family transcriptional regulator [Paenibacillus sp. V4I3]MDQ0890271.1 DNA-binding LacI/PurR family transcriptional regulator [Paenibacillus sp. V4I9]
MEKSPLVKEKLIEQLRNQIQSLQTDQLVKIPSERDLAESFDASRVSVRAAIKILVNEGLLVQLRGKGTYIVPSVLLDTLYVLCSQDIKGNDPFYTNFLVEITNLAAKQAIKISMVNPEHPMESSIPSPLVIIGQIDDETLDELKASSGQLFSIQRYAHRDDIIQIYFDDYRIGSKAAKTLYDSGHRTFTLLGGPDKYDSSRLRKQGFLEYCQQQGVHVQVITEKMNWEGGRRAADTLLSVGLTDAIFAVNDWMAAGFIQGLRENGYQVPADVSVIGCDDIPLAAQISPRLATFSLDAKHLVEELLSAIHRNLSNQTDSREQIVLSAAYISRESVANIKLLKE